MTESQKQIIIELRKTGISYSETAKKAGVPVSTVKSFCRRNSISPIPIQTPETYDPGFCLTCGRVVPLIPGKKQRRFCGNTCRMRWYRANGSPKGKTVSYMFICVSCGKPFLAYGKKDRKYCGLACFFAERTREHLNESHR